MRGKSGKPVRPPRANNGGTPWVASGDSRIATNPDENTHPVSADKQFDFVHVATNFWFDMRSWLARFVFGETKAISKAARFWGVRSTGTRMFLNRGSVRRNLFEN